MKKLMASAAICVIAVSAMAQGTIQMANNASTVVKFANGVNIGGSSAQVQLAWAPTTTTSITPWTVGMSAQEWLALNSSFSLVGTPITIAGAGRFTSATPVTVPGIQPGGIVQAVIFGWTGIGAADALAGFNLAAGQALTDTTGQFAISSVFSVDTGDPTSIPAGTPGNIVTSIAGEGFAGLTLQPVPEPTAFALAGLGAAALMIFRRRN